jgi:putative peptide zinc metalloprotease protein
VFFHPFFLACAAVFTVVSAAVLVWSGGLTAFEPGWFSSWQALLTFYVGLVLLKVIHEAAHAVAVRHYGGQVHETGMTLVAGLPLFYVEASDSYLFPKKSQRIAVAAAGIVAELVLAAVMVWLWLLMADGFSKQLVLNLLLVASVSTILFNGNPLMRFDGYYILAEAIDMPNLRERSKSFVASRIGEMVLGSGGSTDLPRREAWLLGSYGILSQAYLVLVMLGIWRFLSVIAQPQGLQWLANLMVGAWVTSSLLLPFGRFCLGLVRQAASVHGKRRKRALLGVCGGGALLAVLLLVPLPHWVSRSCVLQPAGDSVVRAAVDGFIAEVLVAEGDPVSKDQPLAQLRNNALEAELEAAILESARAETGLRGAVTAGALSDVGQAKAALSASRAHQDKLRRESDFLALSAPCEGTVASRDLAQSVGKFLKAGDILCVIQPADLDEFLIPLDEKQARQVRKGARVELRLRSQPWKLFRGGVIGDPLRLNAEELPAGLLQSSGGDVAVSSAGGRKQTLLADTHFVKVRISDPDPALKIGMTGRVRIECGRQTLAARLTGAIADFVRLDVRMQ